MAYLHPNSIIYMHFLYFTKSPQLLKQVQTCKQVQQISSLLSKQILHADRVKAHAPFTDPVIFSYTSNFSVSVLFLSQKLEITRNMTSAYLMVKGQHFSHENPIVHFVL